MHRSPMDPKFPSLSKETSGEEVQPDGAHLALEKEGKARMIREKILNRLSDEEIERLSHSVEVNTSADASMDNPVFLLRGDNFKKIVRESGTDTLLDLGSADTYINSIETGFNCAKNFVSDKGSIGLSMVGIHKYIGIDLGIRTTEWRTADPQQTIETDGLEYRFLNDEILHALHSLPDDYANACMMGIESGTVIHKGTWDWAAGVISELKRVVPEGGFVYTDYGILGDIIEYVEPKLAQIRSAVQQGRHEELNEYEIRDDDPFFSNLGSEGYGYVVSNEDLGFRIYLMANKWDGRSIYDWSTQLIIINASKERNIPSSELLPSS